MGKINTYRLGLWGEIFLIILLIFRGHKIVARRFKTKLGEIDLIAKKGNNLTVYEVKSSKNKAFMPDIVSPRQWKRIEMALNIFLAANNKYIDYNISYCTFLYKNIFNY
jgi:putative endonuclease